MIQGATLKMKPSNQTAQGLIATNLYQGLDLKALIGSSKEPVISVQEQIQLGIKEEKKKIELEKNELTQTKELLGQLIEERKNWEARMQEDLVPVITEIVKSIVEVELVTNEEIIKNCFLKLLKHVSEEAIQTILINEADHALLVKGLGSELEQMQKEGKFEFDTKGNVPRGTLTATSKQLCIEAGVLEKLKRFLLEAEGDN